MKRSNISSGLLMFRMKNAQVEVLLVHPGGPFFQNKDEGAWSIPKGEAEKDEDLRQRARIEFEEELGFAPPSENWMELGSIEQKGGKTVHAWACQADLPHHFKLRSNTFEIEWPPHSGRRQTFPEVDRAHFFPIESARRKMNPAQTAFLDRLLDFIGSRKQEKN
jgi:predicted NUDIX family NTP pyrophosphohydrolase